MDIQTLFNIAITIIGVLLGWVMQAIRSDITQAKAETAIIAARQQSIEVLVAGRYMTREDTEKLVQALFHKLDRIEEKVDMKVNRSECAGCMPVGKD